MGTVLITGGAGYVGSTLSVELVSRGRRVRVMDRLSFGARSLVATWGHDNFEFVCGDIRDPSAVAAALAGDIEAVVHLAAIVGDPACAREPDEARTVNIEGAMQVYEAAKDSGTQRFVFASTCSNYGKMADPDGFVDESSPLAPISLYAETKVDVERAILDDRRVKGFSPTCLRLATVFGVSPRMRFDLTVNEFVLEMIKNRRLVVYGEQFWRPYVHVRDVARAIAGVLEAAPERVGGNVFNVGATDQNYQKGTIMQLIQTRIPDAVVEFVKKEEDPRDYRVSFAKIERELGFVRSRTVEDGIDEIARWVGFLDPDDFRDKEIRNII